MADHSAGALRWQPDQIGLLVRIAHYLQNEDRIPAHGAIQRQGDHSDQRRMSGQFSPSDTQQLVQKISAGEIAIPLVRIESSQKSAKGVHLADLAEYLDARAEAARKEMIALTS